MIDELLERGSFDAVTELAEAYPLEVFPDAVGMPRENRRYLLPYGNMVFNSFGPRNAFFEEAVRDAEPVLAWVQAQSQRAALAPDGFGAAVHAAADAGMLTADEAPIVVRSILTAGVDTTVSGHRCRGVLPGPFPRPIPQAARQSHSGSGRIRRSRPLREPGSDLLPDHHA